MLGCGGGGGDSTSAPATAAALPTKVAVIKQGDAICTDAQKKQAAAFTAFGERKAGQSEKAGLEELVLKVALPPIQAAAEELDALRAPSDGQEELAAVAHGMEEAVKEAEADPLSVSAGSSESPFAQVQKLASEYGFRVCSTILN